uniref:C-type lectin domain-containing protein n=1 Tax=Panagrolaimus sp. JU765 TaxID=591449 RepID=A0AC34RKP7_9BILA
MCLQRYFFILIIVGTFSLTTFGKTVKSCEDGWVKRTFKTLNGSDVTNCYLAVNVEEGIIQSNAEQKCVENGGHLVSIHSDEENAFISGLFGSFISNNTYEWNKQCWIGLQIVPESLKDLSADTDIEFKWSDNTQVDYPKGKYYKQCWIGLQIVPESLKDLSADTDIEFKWSDNTAVNYPNGKYYKIGRNVFPFVLAAPEKPYFQKCVGMLVTWPNPIIRLGWHDIDCDTRLSHFVCKKLLKV